MSKYKVLTDGNGSGLIHVIGFGVYVPLSDIEKAAAENDALSQKLRAAQHEAEALAASTWAMASKLKEVCELVNTDAGSAIQWILDNHAEVGQLALATPQQHLREIRAEAGRVGFVVGCEYARDYFCSDADKKWFEDNYADKIGWGEL